MAEKEEPIKNIVERLEDLERKQVGNSFETEPQSLYVDEDSPSNTDKKRNVNIFKCPKCT